MGNPEASSIRDTARQTTNVGDEYSVGTNSFKNFDEFWTSNTGTENTVVRAIKSLSDIDVETLKTKLRDRLINGSQGGISYGAFTNAVRGQA